MFIFIMTKKKKAKVAKVAKVKEVATSSAKPTSIRVGKVKQEEKKQSESEGENDEDSVQSSSLIPDGKNGDDIVNWEK